MRPISSQFTNGSVAAERIIASAAAAEVQA